eukprot:GHVN01018510.1.p1 GENE.GHVN01018510.1~~GHVN01018510.1.p1  ORF type:complete len:305 (+),score=25.82 GHVN01018510.1:896-1810(+)
MLATNNVKPFKGGYDEALLRQCVEQCAGTSRMAVLLRKKYADACRKRSANIRTVLKSDVLENTAASFHFYNIKCCFIDRKKIEICMDVDFFFLKQSYFVLRQQLGILLRENLRLNVVLSQKGFEEFEFIIGSGELQRVQRERLLMLLEREQARCIGRIDSEGRTSTIADADGGVVFSEVELYSDAYKHQLEHIARRCLLKRASELKEKMREQDKICITQCVEPRLPAANTGLEQIICYKERALVKRLLSRFVEKRSNICIAGDFDAGLVRQTPCKAYLLLRNLERTKQRCMSAALGSLFGIFSH